MKRTMQWPQVRLKKNEREELRLLEAEDADISRPRTRADCEEGPRPCPWVSCRWNLYLVPDPQSGSIKFNFPGQEIDEIPNTCALDLAELGGMTLDDVGSAINITRERVRQIEERALAKLKRRLPQQMRMSEALELIRPDPAPHWRRVTEEPNATPSRYERKLATARESENKITSLRKRLSWGEWEEKQSQSRLAAQAKARRKEAKRAQPPAVAIAPITLWEEVPDVRSKSMLRAPVRPAHSTNQADVQKTLVHGEQSYNGVGVGRLPNDANQSEELPGSHPTSTKRSRRGRRPGREEGIDERSPTPTSNRDSTGNLGDVHPVQDHSTRRTSAASLLKEKSRGEPLGKARALVVDPNQSTPRSMAETSPSRITFPSHIQRKRDLSQLWYALRRVEGESSYSIVRGLRQSEHVGFLQDRLREQIAESLLAGRAKDAIHTQQLLRVLLGKDSEEKEEAASTEKAKHKAEFWDAILKQDETAIRCTALACKMDGLSEEIRKELLFQMLRLDRSTSERRLIELREIAIAVLEVTP